MALSKSLVLLSLGPQLSLRTCQVPMVSSGIIDFALRKGPQRICIGYCSYLTVVAMCIFMGLVFVSLPCTDFLVEHFISDLGMTTMGTLFIPPNGSGDPVGWAEGRKPMEGNQPKWIVYTCCSCTKLAWLTTSGCIVSQVLYSKFHALVLVCIWEI